MVGRIKILVVDDELIVRESLVAWLKKGGYQVDSVSGGKKAVEMLEKTEYDLIFLDIMMPDIGGLEVLKVIKKRYPQTVVVMITAYGSVETAIEAMKSGANDYLMKPFEPEQLSLLVEKLIQQKKLIDENILLKAQIAGRSRYQDLIGASECMQQLFHLIEEVAAVESPVLLKGETGTGKELVAKAIHAKGPKRYGPFIAINCGAFTENLLETELFGHEVGSFTGATHRDLENEIREGRFRQDFYFRLNVIEIQIPPLRERREDIPLLAQHFLEQFRRETNKPIEGIHDGALDLLMSYRWPGNVRELENALERAVVLAKGRYLGKSDFAFLFRGVAPEMPHSLKEMEKRHIEHILQLCGWNISKAAKMLEINRSTLHNKIKKYDLRPAG